MLHKIDGACSFSSVRNQLHATIIANWIVFSLGCIIGWFSPALPVLLSDKTPLVTGPLTHTELSWISSISSIGAIVGTFLFGTISSFAGSKQSMSYLAFPTIAFWILVRFGNTIYYLLCARFFTGIIIGGMYSVVAVFVSEISNDNIRGRLGSITPLSRNVGLLVGYIAGALFEYEIRPYIFISFPVIYLIWMYTLPSTPQYYLHIKEDYDKAEKALMYYKNCDGKTEHEKSLLKAEFERLKTIENERKKNEKLEWSDFCNRKAFKGVATAIAMAIFMQVSGSFVITNYASLIFEKAGSSLLGPNISSIILASVQIVGGLVSTQAGDYFGRKTSLYISLFGSAVGMFAFSVYLYLQEHGYDVSNYLWVPELTLSLTMFISSAGVVALSQIVSIENFPPKIRSVGVVFYSVCANTVAFLVDKNFPVLMETIQLHGCMLILTICCCFGLIFVIFMDETRGKSLDSIAPQQNKISSDKNNNNSNKSKV